MCNSEQIAKYVHGNSSGGDFNQKVDYTYNIKGWLRKQNQTANLDTDLFAQELKYQDSGNPSSYFNGNIWQTGWLNTGDIEKNYIFSYDGVNRLEAAVYSDGVNNGDFDTGYTYDANGNILTLSRKANGTPVDVLAYSYISSRNRLQSVTDGGNSEGYFAVPGENYEYDTNGNLTTDPSKGTGIEYNYLNLPSRVTFDLDDEARYTYDAAGNKLVKAIQIDGTTGEGRLNYCGNFLYEGTVLKAIFTSAGRIVPFDNNGSVLYKFEYNLQDYLGNTRVAFSGHSNGRPEVMQITDYYPFGMVMNQQNYFASGVLANKYLYNGKELQNDELAGNSLGWYDYGARFYDPELARTTTMDPHAESYLSISPYSMFANNPLLFTDPNGEDINFYLWKYDEDDGWQRKQVQFNQLDATLQKALEGFAKTDAGYTFLKDFANKGDKLGSIEFSETGKYAKHDMDIAQFDTYGSAYGTSSFREGKDNIIFDMKININRNTEDENAESMAITTGHEAFIHIDQYKDKLINAYGKNDRTTVNQVATQQRNNAADRNGGADHDAYIRGNTKYSRMRTFVSQLRTVLNPVQVDKQIKSHDDKFKRQLNH